VRVCACACACACVCDCVCVCNDSSELPHAHYRNGTKRPKIPAFFLLIRGLVLCELHYLKRSLLLCGVRFANAKGESVS
jgi:hypothetical protein